MYMVCHAGCASVGLSYKHLACFQTPCLAAKCKVLELVFRHFLQLVHT